jgi:hypothetical protein
MNMSPLKAFSSAVAGLLLGSSTLLGEIPPSDLNWWVERIIRSQIDESGAWDDSLSGGYLFRFSADLFGDATQEDFVTNSNSFIPNAGWLAFSDGQRIGWLDLSAYEFLLIREGDASIFPSWSTSGGHNGMLVQTWDKTGIKRQSREVHQEELGTFIQDWEARGQVIRPQLEMLRLVDYLQGIREWEPVDLRTEEVEFRGNTRSIVLKRDIERLQTLNLRPEQALEMFKMMPRATLEAVDSPGEKSQVDVPFVARTSPRAMQGVQRNDGTDGSLRLWLAPTLIVIALAAWVFLAYRRRS